MKLTATTQKTGFVISRIARIIYRKTPTRAREKGPKSKNDKALKILAEIAARGGRYDEAADWLSRLLSADPMNGDAAEALARAKGRAAQLTATATPDPVARLVPEAARPPQRNRDLVIEHAPEEPTSPRLDVKGTRSEERRVGKEGRERWRREQR